MNEIKGHNHDGINSQKIPSYNVIPTYRMTPTELTRYLSRQAIEGEEFNALISFVVTMTIASPCVVSYTAHGFVGGESITLSTTGALPTGLTTGATYYVKYVNANTFQLTPTPFGTAINTSGSQSGTHTLLLNRKYIYINGVFRYATLS
jgi:hypothetical protein